MGTLARIGVLVALLGVTGTVVPAPAEATSAGSVVFWGSMTVGSHGIAYPFTGSNTGEFDPNKSPPTHDNSATVAFSSTVCTGIIGNIAKMGKHAVEAGLCVMWATGVVSGYCNAMEGWASGHLGTAGPPVPSPLQSYAIEFSFTVLRGYVILEGHFHKPGHSGVLAGIIEFVPDPTAGSCTNKWQKNFITDGRMALASALSTVPTSLPQ